MKLLTILTSMVVALSFAGCKSSTDSTTTTTPTTGIATPTPTPTPAYFPLEVRSPGIDVVVMSGTNFIYDVAGGKPPYSFTRITGPATVGATRGDFTSGDITGNTVIEIKDSNGTSIEVKVRVTAKIAVAPQNAKILTSTSTTPSELALVTTGGVPPYTYEIIQGSGFVSPLGLYIAPPSPGTTIIRIRDVQNNNILSEIQSNFAPSITPASLLMSRGESFDFRGDGGFPPYTFVTTDEFGERTGQLGTIDYSSGRLTAPQIARKMRIVMLDSMGYQAVSEITVSNAPLRSNAESITLEINKTVTLKPTGGLAPYRYELTFGQGTILPNGTYYAPDVPTDAGIRITDAEDTAVISVIRVNDVLTVAPASRITTPGSAETFTVSGGVPPYRFVIASGSGSINNSSNNSIGSFIAPMQTGRTIIRVTDNANNIKNVTVDINPEIQISPSAPIIAVGNTIPFIGSGGIPEYNFEVLEGSGTMDGSLYRASTLDITEPKTATIRVSDSRGFSKTAIVTIVPKLEFEESVVTAPSGVVKEIKAKNGVPPYTLRFAKGSSLFGSVITNGTGKMLYNPALVTDDSTEVLQITDSYGNKVYKEVRLLNSLVGFFDPTRSRIVFSNTLTSNAVSLTENEQLALFNVPAHNLTDASYISVRQAPACYNFESYDIINRYRIVRLDEDRFTLTFNQRSNQTGFCPAGIAYDVFSPNVGQVCPPVTGQIDLLNLKNYSYSDIKVNCTSTTDTPLFAGTCGTPNCTVSTPNQTPFALQLSRARQQDNSSRDLQMNVPLSSTPGDSVTVQLWFKWETDRSPDGIQSFNGTLVGFSNYNVSFMTVNGINGATKKGLCFNTEIGNADCFGLIDPDPEISNRWAFYTFVFNNGDVTKNKIYINGVEKSLKQLSLAPSEARNVSSNLTIGVNYDRQQQTTGSSFRVRGLLGPVKVYNKLINPNEVLNDYREFKPLYIP